MDYAALKKYTRGLIALSACLAGAVPRAAVQLSYNHAKEEALLLDSLFGRGNFFLELQDHGMADQKAANAALLRLHQETGIPLVATNDVHYTHQEDARPHDVLLCIQTNKSIHDADRLRYDGDQFYLKSPQEMHALFAYAPEALENTARIAARCNVEITFNEYKLPTYPLPATENATDTLRRLCEDGLSARYGEAAPTHRARLQFELDTLQGMGFTDYFLIVWDFIKYAREQGIAVGPGRGSAAGSLVSYCLRITDVDPIRYGLMFERFLNPARISMPDIDIDFCYERRQEVIDYVVAKYGTDRVAQIITFGTMGARAVLRDVGRALGMPYADVDRVAKMIPSELNITLQRALTLNPALRKAAEEEDDTAELFRMASRLEGLTRHASTHAAGVVISDQPLWEYVPLYMADGATSTQFPMGTLEALGLLKMDFLGLRTLTVIRNATEEIKRIHGVDVDFAQIGYDDPVVFQLIASAKTEGVFQLESSGMKAFMRDLAPQNLGDIIAGIALYRPGPMDFIPKYIAGKKDPAHITYLHPALEPILQETYGCIVYQEQVMRIVRELAGYSLARSDLVRRVISKKKPEAMAQERHHFIHGLPAEDVPGCVAGGIPEAIAARIFDEISDFANYAFNKSHAACYAVVGYQTAWLKQYYPVEFMAATLTSVMDAPPKVAEYLHTCKKMGIPLLPPDINAGVAVFSAALPSGTAHGAAIRFGLSAIKNVGRGAINDLVREREANGPFTGLRDFVWRLGADGKEANGRFVEGLIKAGAFDSLGGKRAQYMLAYKHMANGIASERRRTFEGQMSLFGPEEETTGDDLPDIAEFPLPALLADEKDALGVYVSGHPLSAYEGVLQQKTTVSSLDFIDKLDDRQHVRYGGMVVDKSIKYTRATQKPMAFITVEDLFGTVETIVFSQLYEKVGHRLQVGNVMVVAGAASVREDEATKLVAEDITFYEAPQATVWVKIPTGRVAALPQVLSVLKNFPGEHPVKIYNEETNARQALDNSLWVDGEEAVLQALEGVVGEGNVKVK